MFRALKSFARAPLIPQQPPYAIVPMATFRSYAPAEGPRDPQSPKQKERVSSKNESSGTGAPSTDEIAHSDAAYSGSGADPHESSKKIEKENNAEGGMQGTAADPHASKPPKGTSQ